MDPHRKPVDVLVAGGGVIGLTIAWRAAAAGLSVAVVDPTPGEGASRVAAGMLAPVSEAHWGEESLVAPGLWSAAAWPSFAAELEEASGRDVGYRACGALAVAADGSDRSQLEDLLRFQHHLGLEAEWVNATECRSLEPLLSPAIRGGILAHGDHQVETRLVVAALIEACERTGVAIIRDRVASVDPDTGARTATVGLASGDAMSCAEVVVAAGCWSAAIDGFGPDVVIPVRPVKGQILRLRMPAGLPALARNVLCVVAGSKCYVVPRRDGRVVVGATVEERGFDTDVTAGPVYELLRDSSRILPSVLEMSLLEANAGLRPGSPDNLPMVGRLGAAMVATGHYRNGILLAPVTAQLVVGALIGRDETDPTLVAAASVLDPRRFASRSATSTAPGGTGA